MSGSVFCKHRIRGINSCGRGYVKQSKVLKGGEDLKRERIGMDAVGGFDRGVWLLINFIAYNPLLLH